MYERDLATALAQTVMRRGARGFTFEDLLRVASRSRLTISAVADWLAMARSSGFVDDVGFDEGPRPGMTGPRRYRIASTRTSGIAKEATRQP